MSLAARLRELRLKKNQSFQELADKVGVSKTHVWELEKGATKNPSSELLAKLADNFGVTIRFLVGEQFEDDKADEQLSRMFRQVGTLTDRDKAILDDMIQSMAKRRRDESTD